MSGVTGTVRSYLELARLSNIPTVITNVLVGVSLAGLDATPSWLTIAWIAAAIILLYVAGMALNDVVDAPIDATERPDRPIPSGRVSRRAGIVFTATCMLLAIGIVLPFGRYAFYFVFTLAGTIILYDLYHKRWRGSVVLMGFCRLLVYLGSAAALTWPLPWAIAAPAPIAMLLYIVLLTAIARLEAKLEPGRRTGYAYLLPLPVLAAFLFIQPDQLLLPLLAGSVFIAWMTSMSWLHLARTPPRIPLAVQSWLAGICLADAYFLALLDEPVLMFAAFACFGLTLLGHRFIMGT